MIKSACIGFCRSSDNRKLSEIIEKFLSKEISEFELKNYCKNVRLENIRVQKEHNVDFIASNDFAMYDHMIDATCLVGNIQKRYYWEGGKIPLDIYFSLAKGVQKDKFDVMPLELRNWLNTNYLYHVPEFVDPIEFSYSDNKPIIEYLDAKSIGVETRSTIIGPISYLLQGKSMEHDIQPIDLVEDILPVYQELFTNYSRVGVKSIQIEDPMLCNCIDRDMKDKYTYCYNELRKYANGMEINLITYYGSLRENFDFICSLPVDSIHIDVSYNKNYINDLIEKLHKNMTISLGVIDARNLWKTDLNSTIDLVSRFCSKIGEEHVIVSTSSPLFLCPYSVEKENNISQDLKRQLSFAVEKLDELNIVKTAINCGRGSVSSELNENKKLFSKPVYSHSIGVNDNIKQDNKYVSKWEEFIDGNKLKINPMFFIGNTADDIQKEADVDIISTTFTQKSYDIADYAKYTKGLYVCNNNSIPRFGTDYFEPTIIYDNVLIDENIFVNCIQNKQKLGNKPLKFAVCSPLHFINFGFVSPFVDYEKLIKMVFEEFLKCIKKVSKNIDLLQINEFTIKSNISISNVFNINYITNYFNLLNTFILSLKKHIKYFGYCNAFCDINDLIEYICKMNIDIFITTSVRSRHDIISSFVSYKPDIPVAFGLIDPYSSRFTTKNEVYFSMKKIFSCIKQDQIVITTDGDFADNKDKEKIFKSIKNIYTALKELTKEIEKETKSHKMLLQNHEEEDIDASKSKKTKTAKSQKKSSTINKNTSKNSKKNTKK